MWVLDGVHFPFQSSGNERLEGWGWLRGSCNELLCRLRGSGDERLGGWFRGSGNKRLGGWLRSSGKEDVLWDLHVGIVSAGAESLL